jgi:spermidine/putrescine transport system permease protein
VDGRLDEGEGLRGKLRRRLFWPSFLVPSGLWLLAFYAVPLGFVVAVSLATTDVIGNPIYGWHPENYQQVISATFLPPLLRSLGFASAATAICLLVGYPVAYTLARFGGRYKGILVALIVLPWFVDYLVRIYAWVVMFDDHGVVNGILSRLGMHGSPPARFLNTSWAVIGGLVYDYFPFMVLPLFAAIDHLDPRLVEAGKDLYGTPRQTFWRVTWPCTFQGILAGCVLVFLPSAGDFVTAEILGGPNTSMIGTLVQDQFSGGGYWPFGAALTVVLIALLSTFMVFYLRSTARATESAAAW